MTFLIFALAAVALPCPTTKVFLPADAGFRGGAVVKDTHEARTWLPQELFRYHREGVTLFDKELTPGDYVVRLNLIERDPLVRAATERMFTVRIGVLEFSNIDLWDQAGGHHVPLQQVARVHLPEGKLRVEFVPQSGKTTIASIEVLSVCGAMPNQAFQGSEKIEDYSRFARHPETLAQVGKSDDKSGWVKNTIVAGNDGSSLMRMEYSVDTSLPYGNLARFNLPLAKPFQLDNQKSLKFMLWPDGSGRKAAVVLHGQKSETAMFQVRMDGVEPLVAEFSLEHVSPLGDARSTDGPLHFPVTSITYLVASDPAVALGQGSVTFGSIVATGESAALPPPSARSDFQPTPDALRIEGFENYVTNSDLWEHVASTSHANISRVSLSKGNGFVGEGKQSVRLDYTFDRRAYSGIVFMRPMDTRPYNVFRFWLKGDGSKNKLMVFFALGGIHQFEVPLNDRKGKWINVPLSSFLGETATRNGIVEIGFWARRHANSQGGTIYLDEIGLVKDPSEPNTPAQRPPAVPIAANRITRIDVGSDVPTVDKQGNTWGPDRGFQFGRTHILNAREIENDHSDYAQVHQTFRVGMLGYAFAVPNGKYTVNMITAENWLGAKIPGRRVCHIQIGDQDLGDVDIIAETKHRFMPLTKSATVQVNNGVLQLEFRDKANHCKVDALEIVPVAVR